MTYRNISVYGVIDLISNLWRRYELRRVANKLPILSGGTVLSGPFAGMRFGDGRSQSEIMPKLIGSYECELHDIVESLIKLRFTTIINVGAAEGYYAVGMAVKCPQAKVVAFEMDDTQAEYCRSTAILNSVERRVAVRGKCDRKALIEFDLKNALIIMDCEGAELDILDDDIAPKFVKTWLLIELHDALRPGCSRILWQRYEKTHVMAFIKAVSRNLEEFAILKGLSPRRKLLALDEKRLGLQEWVLMTPKS